MDVWLTTYLGADDTEYCRAVGARWLISAVARVFRPGVKANCCLILEGPQGIRKSTALRTIAGEYFTDELADLGSKDAAMQTRGVWIIELELDNLGHAEVARIKAFMSRTTDRFRAALWAAPDRIAASVCVRGHRESRRLPARRDRWAALLAGSMWVH